MKDPSRKLRIPKNLRPKDKQVLSWEQLWLILAKAGRRDRLLLMRVHHNILFTLREQDIVAASRRTTDGLV